MITLDKVTVRAGGRAIVEDVSATLAMGRLAIAVGPSGAGKTTLLRAMSGEVPIARGDVLLEQRSIRLWPRKKLALRGAVMPWRGDLPYPVPAREVAALGRVEREQWCSRGHNEAVVMKAMEVAGVAHLAQRFYPSLSEGERQGVQLARALSRILDAGPGASRYLWLDEPSGMDPAQQHHLLRVAREFARGGAAVFCAMHDRGLASEYADDVLVLDRGRLVEVR